MEYIRSYLIGLIFINWFCLQGALPEPSPVFVNFSTQQGLSSNWVKSVLQDRHGYIWFITGDGLHKFDGNRFDIFQNNPEDKKSLPVNNCKTMVFDHQNVLWLGHHLGVSRMDPSTGEFLTFQYMANNQESLPSNDVVSMSVAPDGKIWVATLNDGLAIIDPTTFRIQRINDLPGSPVNFKMNDTKTILCTSDGNIWIGSYIDGLKCIDWKTKTIHAFNKPEIPVNSIVSLWEGKDRRIWIGTLNGGVLEFDRAQQNFVRHLSDNKGKSFIESVHCITDHENGELWLACENKGLIVYNPATKRYKEIKYHRFQPNGLPHHSIQTVFKDASQNIWVGTFAGGLAFYRYPNNVFGHYFNIPDEPNSLSENALISLLEDSKGNFWVGTDGGGITRYNTDNSITFYGNHPKSVLKLPSDVIVAMHEDRNKQIWIGTLYKGIQVLNPATNSLKSISEVKTTEGKVLTGISASAFCEEDDGDMWIGTWGKGVLHYSKSENVYRQFLHNNTPNSLGGNFVFAICKDKSGVLWVSTSAGLSRVEPATFSFKTFINENNNSKNISGFAVFHAVEDSKGRLWLATDKGLNLYDRLSNTFKSYKAPRDFPANDIFQIQEDKAGYIWCGSNKGLIRFDPAKETYELFTKFDGIQDRKFAVGCSAKLRNGFLAFGGFSGFNLFDPLRIPLKAPDDVIYCYLENSGASVLLNDSMRVLDFSNRNFDLHFLNLDFDPEKNVTINYRLEGFDEEWKSVRDRGRTSYTNLDPGAYTFVMKVEYSQLKLVKEFRYPIKVDSPVWQRWYWWLLLAAVLVWLLIKAFKLRTKYFQRQKGILEQRIEVRTAEIVKQKQEIESLLNQIQESLDVAQSIQQSLLPSEQKFQECFVDAFTFYRPLAKVSGDFYWLMKRNSKIYLAMLDCTGHGVPGAILAMMANDKLNEIARTHSIQSAGEFLQLLQGEHGELWHSDSNMMSGMDIAFCIIDPGKKEIQFAGAKAPLVLTTKEEVKIVKGSRFPIGNSPDASLVFENTIIPYSSGDMLYLYTDGLIDQLGGENGSKYLLSRLKKNFEIMHSMKASDQKETIMVALSQWMGTHEQLDDMSLIGVRL